MAPILVKTGAEAVALKNALAAGEAFDVLAPNLHLPLEKRGGDLGEVRPGEWCRQWIRSFSEAAEGRARASQDSSAGT